MRGSGSATAPAFTPPPLADGTWTPVVAIFDETPDIRTFRVARPKGFDFEAGQSLGVDVEYRGKIYSRRYSISSAPETVGHLDISVRRRGVASEALHDSLAVGSLLSVTPPEGSFVYPAGDPRPLVLIGGGIGCIPLVSMLRHSALCDPERPITFLLSARTARDVPFRRELHVLSRRPGVRVGVSLTRDARRAGYVAGRIDEKLLRRAAANPEASLFLVCAPPEMLADILRILAELGVPESSVRSESWDAPATARETAVAREIAAAPEIGLAVDAVLPAPLLFDPESSASRRRREKSPESEISGRIDALAFPLPETKAPEETHHDPGEDTLTARILRFPGKVKEILRFQRGERMLHWSIAIPFMTCFATGMILKIFYDLHPEGTSRDVLSFVHRVAGGCLAVFPALALLRNWREYRVHLYNIKVGWIWTVDDVKWLFLMGPAAFSKRFTLPDQRKFNAAERLNFMAVMVTYPTFVTTGIVLCTPGIHFVPWVVHFGLALAVVPLMFGHIFMATVNPETRVGLSGMITGHVDRTWASHHYAAWYRELFDPDGRPKS